jgi:hypothetical protein
MAQYKITSIETAEKLIAEFLVSKQNRKVFCHEHGINVNTFNWWLKRHSTVTRKKNKTEVDIKAPFVQIKPTNISHGLQNESEIAIDLKSGTRVRWRGNEIPSSFYDLLTVLSNGVAQ